ncbi:MAG: response regulator [Spartobacteria bacterium]|nr:response regulator [Spartobacteria bacterium]
MAKILVAEDDVITQKLILAILEKDGHVAFISPNGRHALETLQVNPFDLLITDVMMPELDGRSLIEAMHKHPRLKNIPVIIISAVIKASDVMDLLEHGATFFVPKPLHRADLLEYTNLAVEQASCTAKEKAAR